MNAEKQRVAIAGACGWQYDIHTEEMIFTQGGDICGVPWPSLDACHEMEKVLTKEQLCDYVNRLAPPGYSIQVAICATAAQRCEAFLRTLNLWEPAPHD